MKIRALEKKDYPAILKIYNPYITDTCITLEIEPLSLEAFSARLDSITEHFPFIVAVDDDGSIIGYAYLSAFHPRAAYRFTCDLSIYCDMEKRGRGTGTALYNEIEKIAREAGFRNIVSIITDKNLPSVEFHKKLGFTEQAHFEHIAFKHGGWLGVYYLIKVLDGTDSEPAFTGSYGIRA